MATWQCKYYRGRRRTRHSFESAACIGDRNGGTIGRPVYYRFARTLLFLRFDCPRRPGESKRTFRCKVLAGYSARQPSESRLRRYRIDDAFNAVRRSPRSFTFERRAAVRNSAGGIAVDSIVLCTACSHGVPAHDEMGCGERLCLCPLSRRVIVDLLLEDARREISSQWLPTAQLSIE